MLVQLRSIRKISRRDYRLALDVIDPDRQPWDHGDCILQVDLHDGMSQHLSVARGLLRSAIDLYKLTPEQPPAASEALLLWEMGRAVHRYVDRLFEAGILCPFGEPEVATDDAPEESTDR
jgi:hypothetical protein